MMQKNSSILLMKVLTILLLFSVIYGFKIQNQATNNGYFNLELAQTYAGYAALAYCPRKCLENWDCKIGQKYPKLLDLSYINSELTLAALYIGYQPLSKTIIISWRGTTNAQNFIQDMHFIMQPFFQCTLCQIHSGFLDDYLANEKKINIKINELLTKYPVIKIVLTGHSLGAAMASINSVYIAISGIKVPLQVYNYGSPRFGNQRLAKFVNQKVLYHYRIVHNRDIIPHFPSQELRYRHAAKQIFFNQQMTQYTICSNTGQDPNCSNHFSPAYNINDHHHYFINIYNPQC